MANHVDLCFLYSSLASPLRVPECKGQVTENDSLGISLRGPSNLIVPFPTKFMASLSPEPSNKKQ